MPQRERAGWYSFAAVPKLTLKTDTGTATYEQDGETAVVTVDPGPSKWIAHSTCRTSYPPELVQRVLDVKGVQDLCDELLREEDPLYVRNELTHGILGFVPADWFRGRRILDFGSGSGSSTIVLQSLLPGAHVVGVELRQDFVDLAKERLACRGLHDVEFHLSPTPEELPSGLGLFDAVALSAVYEHLLPNERAPLLCLLWASIAPGGYLFVNQLPHRWFPYEQHTAMLWGINYLPRSIVGPATRRFSRRHLQDDDWPTLLRKGIRGGTQRDILRRLQALGDGRPEVVPPAPPARDHADLWLSYTMQRSPGWKKRAAHVAFKGAERILGQPVNQSVMAAFRKAPTTAA